MANDHLTTGEAARALHLSINKVKSLFAAGVLKGYCVPGRGDRRITKASIEALIGPPKSDDNNQNNDKKDSSDT